MQVTTNAEQMVEKAKFNKFHIDGTLMVFIFNDL